MLEAEPISTEPQQALYAPEAPAGTLATLNVAKNAGRAPSPVTVTVPTAAEATLNVSEKNGVPVMSSMDIVAFVNSTRTKHEKPLEHFHFMEKVREEIDNASNFRGIYIDKLGREKACY